MTNAAANLYEFGQFRLNKVKRLLLRDGEAVALPPKGVSAGEKERQNCRFGWEPEGLRAVSRHTTVWLW